MTESPASTQQLRPPRPKRVGRGVEVLWNKARARWVFRSRIMVDGKPFVGPIRERADDALRDRWQMDKNRSRARGMLATLEDLLEDEAEAARARGVAEITITRQFVSLRKALLRFFDGSTRMTSIDERQVQAYVRWAINEQGRSPNTVRGKDLPLLTRCFAAVGLESPVPQVLREMRTMLKYRPAKMEHFTLDELQQVLARMRHETFWPLVACEACAQWDAKLRRYCEACEGWRKVPAKHRRPLPLPNRMDDAALTEFFGCTGARIGEFGRVLMSDIEPDRSREDWFRVRIREPKDRGNPRDLFVAPELVPSLTRLMDRARRMIAEGTNPHGHLVPDLEQWAGRIWSAWQPRLRERRLCGRTLRHTFATGALAVDVHPNNVKQLMGHKHLAMTDRYVHAIADGLPDAAAALTKRVVVHPSSATTGTPTVESA